jgi:LDH2 family malate/lactate/ureidoglycolate dehydrogenase
MKPDLFISADEYRARMNTLVQRVHGCPTAEGFDEVLMPGEMEARQEALRRRTGLPFSRGEVATLQEEAARAGVPALEVHERPLAA